MEEKEIERLRKGERKKEGLRNVEKGRKVLKEMKKEENIRVEIKKDEDKGEEYGILKEIMKRRDVKEGMLQGGEKKMVVIER